MSIDKNAVSKRLREFGDTFNTMKQFAEALNISQQTLSSGYLNGRSLPGAELLLQLQTLGCDIKWLLTGEGEMQTEKVASSPIKQIEIVSDNNPILAELRQRVEALEQSGSKNPEATSEPIDHPSPFTNTIPWGMHFNRYPLVSVLGAGSVMPLDTEVTEWVIIDYPDKNCIAMRVIGDSMSPRIENDDIVLISINIKPAPGDVVAVRTKEGEHLIKRYLAKESDMLTLWSENPAHKLRNIRISELDSVRKVVLCQKRFNGSGIEYAKGNLKPY